jgi:hypothetical protein
MSSKYTRKTAPLAERKKRYSEEKDVIQNKIELIKNEQLQYLAFMLKSYDDAITQLCTQYHISQQQVINDAFNANEHMLKSGHQSVIVTEARGMLEDILLRKISFPEINASLASSNGQPDPSTVMLMNLLNAFHLVVAHAEDLGFSYGALIKASSDKKYISVMNSSNRQGWVSDNTVENRKAAKAFLKLLLLKESKAYVLSQPMTELVEQFNREYQPYKVWEDDRPYIKALKIALAELGLVKSLK